MLLPIDWTRDFVEVQKGIVEIADGLSASGSHIEVIKNMREGLDDFLVAQVKKIEKHPQADRLLLVDIDYGASAPIRIVTGASNMAEGDFVIYAPSGTVMPDGLTIEPRELQGVLSEGMLCSYKELGYGEDIIPLSSKEGVIILEGDFVPGQKALQALSLEDPVLEVEITPNRPDCLSIVGLARELAASFDQSIQLPPVKIKEEGGEISNYFDGVRLESDKCLRYVAKVCTEVQVKDSPQWLQNRLMLAGMRPINNIVDITNYVMLELGQPLHAFDLDQIGSREILVRQAQDQERMTSLDGQERKLLAEDLLITNGQEALALAGIMGGQDSEITKATQTLLIESACFQRESVRKTSKRLNLRTEASTRFEKGLSPELSLLAAQRVCQLIEETGAGRVVQGTYDVYPNPIEEKKIEIDHEAFERLLGAKIEKEFIVRSLGNLDFIIEDLGSSFRVTVPSFRMDVRIPEDLIEEVGRLYGFHKIEPRPLVGILTQGKKSRKRQVVDRAKEILTRLQASEILTYSFISPRAYQALNLELPEDLIYLENPLGEDYSVMRTTLMTNMMDALGKNNAHGRSQVSFYEIGNTFHRQKGAYEESLKLALGSYGKDFYWVKDQLEKFLGQMGLASLDFARETQAASFHPGRCAKIYYQGSYLGILGEVHSDIAEGYHMKKRTYLAEVDFEKVVANHNFNHIYQPIIRYPMIDRDLALVVDKDLESRKIEMLIKEASDLIVKVELFDDYRGLGIEEGKKSLAYRILYQAPDRTLKDEEIEVLQKNILMELEDQLGAHLRA